MATATLRNDSSVSFQPNREMESVGKSLSLRCLNEAIDASPILAKVLAEEHLEVSEGEFSKLRAGRFRVEHIDRLPQELIDDWQTRLDAARAKAGMSHEDVVLARLAHAVIDALALVKQKRRMAKAGI